MGAKKILAISSVDDTVTEKILSFCNTLLMGKVDITRINFQDEAIILQMNLPLCRDLILIRGKVHDLNDYDFILYRRGFINFRRSNSILIKDSGYKEYLENEVLALNRYFFRANKKKFLSCYFDEEIPKLLMLKYARDIGLEIPQTIITTSKEELISFYNQHKRKIITKALQNSVVKTVANKFGGVGTVAVSKKLITTFPNEFFPSFFQEHIEKSFEIRSFYLDGKFYSMSIFSQSNKKTKLDFRNYDYENPNRVSAYKLPTEIMNKLRSLFKQLELNTGSVDIIKANNGKYYFLEINHVGQFMQVSTPCNFQLEKRVAEYIVKKIYAK